MPQETIKKWKERYFKTKSSADMEFPYWYSREWFENDGEINIVRRAKALKRAFTRLTPSIFPNELIVMGKTRNMRGSYPMPWLSGSYFMAAHDQLYKDALDCGKLSADKLTKFGQGGGNVTKSGNNVISIAGKFGLRKEELPMLMEMAKIWKGKSVEDIGHKYEKLVPQYKQKEAIMKSLICMFDSGYTIPQGREVMNYYYPLQYGIDGMIDFCQKKINEVAGRPDMDRLYFYKAAILSLEGVKTWILNYAEKAELLSDKEKDSERKRLYAETAERLKWLSSNPPRTFHEALQLCWTFHIAVLNEDCISGMSPGRLGQVLYPWWKKDMASGILNKEKTMELLECMRMKFTELDCFASMGVVGGVLSGNTFNNLSIGGLTKDGQSAANELEMFIIESGMTCATPQPTLTILYNEKLPEEFLLKGVQCVKTGAGYPAWVNDQTAMDFLMRNYGPEGMTTQDARAWAIGGCLETSPGAWMPLKLDGKTHWIPGGSAGATSVGVHFISTPKILELVLFNGMDKRTGLEVFKDHDYKLKTYEEVWLAFKDYFSQAVDVLCLCNNVQHDAWRKITPPIINSALKPDCLEKGKDIGQKGSRFNATFNIEVCGGINFVNSLASLKKNVFEEKNFTLEEMKDAMIQSFGHESKEKADFHSKGERVKNAEQRKWIKIHKLCLDAPKYGNDDFYVDSIFKEWEDWFCAMCGNFISLYDKPMYPCQISVSTHGSMGAATMAAPDGRLSWTTFADGSVSAYPGTDKNGPYALFNSATVWDHSASQNSQLNMKIHPSVVKGREGSKKLLEIIKAYLRKGAFHIQFNVVDSETLKDAQKHPEKYRELMVRVAGFTQYWVELGKPIQDEVIARTEYCEIA